MGWPNRIKLSFPQDIPLSAKEFWITSHWPGRCHRSGSSGLAIHPTIWFPKLFAGRCQEELRDAYCGADVFAFLSLEETEGIVVLEALSCGIPTVLRDIPVYQGWLPEGSGIWKARDAAGFQQAVREALTCPLHDTDKAGRSIALSRRLESV